MPKNVTTPLSIYHKEKIIEMICTYDIDIDIYIHYRLKLVEHRSGIAEVMGSNPVKASEFFLGFLCNCF